MASKLKDQIREASRKAVAAGPMRPDVVEQVRSHFGDTTYRTIIPRTVRLSEAPSYGEPIEAYDEMSRGAIAYRELAREFRRRHGRT